MQLISLLDRFARNAQRQVGATHVADEACRSAMIPAPPGSKVGQAYTQSCGNESLFKLPVRVEGEPDVFRKPERALVCVIDDMAYEFPKYSG